MLILTAGALAATAILAGAVLDSTPPPLYRPGADLGQVALTHDPAPADVTTP